MRDHTRRVNGVFVAVAGLASGAIAQPAVPHPELTQKLCPSNPPVIADPAVWLRDPIPVIMAGDETGSPPDSPANRVDPNTPDSPWAGVAHLTLGGMARCTGVAISRFHILSAGHCVDFNDDGLNDIGTDVVIQFNDAGAGSTIIGPGAINSVTVHPDFTGFNNPAVNDDLVLITLNQPLPASIPVYPPFIGQIVNGQIITLVGYGRTGFADVGATTIGDAATKRVGRNRAEQFFTNDEGGPIVEVFQHDFDGPNVGTNCFGGPSLGNDDETGVAPGDSGGPSFVAVNGRLRVWGVNTFTANCIGPATLFGSVSGGIVINAYLSWLAGMLPPSPFALLSPADGAIAQPAEPTLAWEKADFAGSYTITIATDPALTQIVFQQTGLPASPTSFLVPAGALAPGATYYWSVTADNGNGFTLADSGPFSLSTQHPADLNGDGAVNGGDIAAVLNQWGAVGAVPEDLNNDGVVSGADIAVILNGWTG